MNITDNNTTYIVPLDGIDLSYITTKTKFPTNNGVSLWNGSKHSSGEYYEINIMARKQLESGGHETNNENHSNDPMFHCQVCNLSIPLGYKKQHILSPKHKTCLKILEAAIDRTKNLILATDEDTVRPASDSYFCEPCAIAVKTFKRDEHELSKEHFKSLQHDRFLNDLLLIYVDKGHLDNVDFEYMTRTNKNCDEEKTESTSNIDSESANDNVTEEVDDFMNLMEYLENVHVFINYKDVKILKANEETDINVEKDKNGVISLKDYIEMLTNNSHSSLSPKLAMKGDKLELATSDKSVIYLTEDNFHGFSKKNYSNRIHCKLCDLVFIDENGHKMLPEHMKKVMTPISDMHGIRQFQGSMYRHCVLCNASMYNTDEHKTSEAHINILRNALSLKNIVNNIEQSTNAANQPSRTYCSPCAVYIDTHNFAGHTKGKTHKENVASISTKTNNTPTLSPNTGIDTAKKTFCAPCKIYIDTNDLNSHINGKRHKANVSSTEKEGDGGPTTSDTNEFKTFCTTCNLYINMNAYKSHIGGKSHKSKLLTLTDIEEFVYSTTETGKVCKICNVNVPATEKNLREHCQGNNHAKNFESLLSKYKIRKLNNKLICGKCDKHFDIKSFLDHIETQDVKQVPSKLRLCRICNVQVTDTPKAFDVHKNSDSHKTNLEEFQHPHLNTINDDDDFVECNVCGIDIDLPESKAHVKSQSHLQEFTRLVSENKVLIREGLYICTLCSLVINDEEEFFDHIILDILHKEHKDSIDDHKSITCIFCNVKVPFSQNNIEIHENGAQHKKKFRNVFEILNFKSCTQNQVVHISNKTFVRFFNFKAFDVHKNSDSHKNNLEEFQHPHSNTINDDDDFVKCSVCGIDIDLPESKAHVKSQSHLQEFDRLVTENKVVIREGLYICTLCSLVINDEDEFLDHIILDTIHKELKDSIDDHKSIKCIFCNVKVPYSQKNIEIHENGAPHKKKFRNVFEILNFKICTQNQVVHISNETFVRYFN